jgi:membrane-bound ClpP family serine protease
MKTRWLVLDTVVVAILKEAALVVVALWGLPMLGLNLPLWLVVLIGMALAVQSYFSHMLTVKAQRKRSLVGLDTMVGRCGVVASTLHPDGYVKVDGELWKAVAAEGEIERGAVVEVEAVEGMMVRVKRSRPKEATVVR